jgi:hypothetical protein
MKAWRPYGVFSRLSWGSAAVDSRDLFACKELGSEVATRALVDGESTAPS